MLQNKKNEAQFNLIYSKLIKDNNQMGNQQGKKIGKANKNQIEMAALKAKIHLELMRDRKSQEIIKGEKELVSKLNAKSRNRTQQALIMERVVNGLKYSQAVNQLISYAVSLKSQAAFLSENVGSQEKLAPWLPSVHSLLYAADQLGLSSLNEFKTVMAALNNPLQAEKYVNPEIKQMLSPTPTPYEINIYVLEMSERNNIELEAINAAGHKFSKDPQHPQTEVDKSFSDIEKQLADQFQKEMGNNNNNNGNRNPGGNNGGFGGNPGYGGYGGFGGGVTPGVPGGFGGNGGWQGFNNVPNLPPAAYYHNPHQNFGVNPYKGASQLKHGPDYFTPSQIKPSNNVPKPKQFDSYDNLGGDTVVRKTVEPIYPSVNPNAYKNSEYKPNIPPADSREDNDNRNGNGGNVNEVNTKSPTISQIMRDFDIK